ncbi:extensin family protein [Sphingomicrobium sp. XHP0235]|uniref:extensin-like domain-containing protein n=1 Tax=Sphingomicrobium aquimarinum TaxID=3133971 RepID=UPI0031FE7186
MASDRALQSARGLLVLVGLAIAAVIAYIVWLEAQRYVDEHPEKFPFTPLSLNDPVGPFTAQKLADLAEDPQACLALLREVDVADALAAPRRSDNPECGYEDGIAVGALDANPADLITACPAAAALYLWQRDVVTPAAETHLASPLASFSHAGSYNCRRLYGRSEGAWSRHATADAVDITGFRLVDGRSVSVLGDWQGAPEDAAFLREVRDGACDLFSSVLSPDYNAAHADHFHLAMREGSAGWTACR